MPIIGISERKRFPRLGKIHIGIKATNDKGITYPKAVDYFVCPEEVQKVYGEQPKSLRIMFPVEDDSLFASQFYRCYSRSRGLICKGDGEHASRLVDTATGNMADRDTKETALAEVECLGRECEFYGPKCREMMMLQFLLPDVPGLGIWQLDTSSINGIINVNSAIALIKGLLGRISLIPLNLTLEPLEVQAEGKKKTVHVLNLRMDTIMKDMMKLNKLEPPARAALPEPDDEVPDLIIPEAQEPKEPKKGIEVPEIGNNIYVDLKCTEPKPEPPPPDDKRFVDTVNKMCREIGIKKGTAQANDLLGRYKAKQLIDLTKEQRAELINHLKELIELKNA